MDKETMESCRNPYRSQKVHPGTQTEVQQAHVSRDPPERDRCENSEDWNQRKRNDDYSMPHRRGHDLSPSQERIIFRMDAFQRRFDAKAMHHFDYSSVNFVVALTNS